MRPTLWILLPNERGVMPDRSTLAEPRSGVKQPPPSEPWSRAVTSPTPDAGPRLGVAARRRPTRTLLVGRTLGHRNGRGASMPTKPPDLEPVVLQRWTRPFDGPD